MPAELITCGWLAKSILLAHIPTRSSDSAAFTNAPSQPGSGSVSLFFKVAMSPLQKVRTLPTQCRALKRLEGQESPLQRPNHPNKRKHRRARRLFRPPWLPLLPSFLSPFRLQGPYSGLPEAVQPPDIDHRRRPNHHTGYAEAAPYRGFPSRKRMFHTAHRGFYCRPQVPPSFPMLAGATPTFRSLQRFGRETQDPLSQPFPLDHRATGSLGTGGAGLSKDRQKGLARRGCAHPG